MLVVLGGSLEEHGLPCGLHVYLQRVPLLNIGHVIHGEGCLLLVRIYIYRRDEDQCRLLVQPRLQRVVEVAVPIDM